MRNTHDLRLAESLVVWEPPEYSAPSAIAFEDNASLELVAVEALNRIVQAFMWVDARRTWQGIGNGRGPAFFRKCCENQYLILGRMSEPLDQFAVQYQFSPLSIPVRARE